MMIERKFRHIFMTTLNRINSNSVAVQTFLGAQEVSPGLEIHCSLEHGKNKTTVAGEEHHRVEERQASNDECKASVTTVDQSFPEVTSNITLHNDVKTTSVYQLKKKFRKQVEDILSRTTYPPSSFIPFSTVDAQVQKHLEILNEKMQVSPSLFKKVEGMIDWSALQRSQLHDSIIVLTGEAAISANTGTSKPTKEDAAAYFNQVKVEVPNVCDEFMDELKRYKQKEVDTKGLINSICWLFTGHEISSDSYVKLMLGFNIFLPNHYKICLATEQLRQQECEQLQVEEKKRQLELELVEVEERKRAEKKHHNPSVDVPSCSMYQAFNKTDPSDETFNKQRIETKVNDVELARPSALELELQAKVEKDRAARKERIQNVRLMMERLRR